MSAGLRLVTRVSIKNTLVRLKIRRSSGIKAIPNRLGVSASPVWKPFCAQALDKLVVAPLTQVFLVFFFFYSLRVEIVDREEARSNREFNDHWIYFDCCAPFDLRAARQRRVCKPRGDFVGYALLNEVADILKRGITPNERLLEVSCNFGASRLIIHVVYLFFFSRSKNTVKKNNCLAKSVPTFWKHVFQSS